MKVIVVGDTPNISTGFARCAEAAALALHRAGHEVHVLGISEQGDPHDYPFKIWPCKQAFDHGTDLFGVSRLPVLLDRLKADIALILQDPWNVNDYFKTIDTYFKDVPHLVPPVVGWLACDSRNQFTKPLNRLAHVIVWTQFAVDEIRAGGYEGTTSIVPLGVDHSVFYPRDKQQSRAEFGLGQDEFVIGMVGRLQTRKRIDVALEAFAQWVHSPAMKHTERKAVLYLHVAPTNDKGCNIQALVHYYKLDGHVALCEPHVGKGVDNSRMPFAYSAMDVYLCTSQAEGWGLPALEAMACGVPCVLPDFASFGRTGWVGDNAIRVKCSTHGLTAPMNARPYTIGAVPDVGEIVKALDSLYRYDDVRLYYSMAGLAKATEFSWERTGSLVVSELERVVSVAEERRRQKHELGVDSAEPAALEPAQSTAVST